MMVGYVTNIRCLRLPFLRERRTGRVCFSGIGRYSILPWLSEAKIHSVFSDLEINRNLSFYH